MIVLMRGGMMIVIMRPPYQDRRPDSKVHGANMEPTWDLSAAGLPHVSPMNLAIWAVFILRWGPERFTFRAAVFIHLSY